jgi:hypothetical protein
MKNFPTAQLTRKEINWDVAVALEDASALTSAIIAVAF